MSLSVKCSFQQYLQAGGRVLLYIINPILPLVIYFVSCNTVAAKKKPIPASVHTEKYEQIKKEISQKRQDLKKQYKVITPQNRHAIANSFLDLFEQKIVTAWLGTKWNFNGTTQTPQVGSIACGYFVTTSLQHLGHPIDRVKYAQCASSQLMQHLVDSSHYKIYNTYSFDMFIEKLLKKKDFAAVIGLDKHTGFLLKRHNQLYFIHSSYISNRGVVKQIAKYSEELKGSRWRSVAFLTDSDYFLQQWLFTNS